ncbi:MAG: hypothetical protein QNI86_10735 [Halieaceae bacterium]|nr:hypothetical protein [Halieaceae bacterium]
MREKICLFLAAGITCLTGWAQVVDTSELGQLKLEYASVSASETYAGQPLAALAAYRAGESVSVITLPRVQQIHYLLPPGTEVQKGQAIARLVGPEVHHFLTEFELVGKQLALAESRFLANRDLYQQQAIDEARWMTISSTYYELKLEHEHLDHFHALLETGSEHDRVLLTAPAGGIVQYRQPVGGIPEGGEVVRIVPKDSLRLRVDIPVARRAELTVLSSGSCRLGVEEISGVASEFRVTAWSTTLSEQCTFVPGQRLMATPWYRGNGFRIPAESLMQWQGASAVLVHEGQQLVPTPVDIVGGIDGDYFVRCAANLADREVLVTSVSAVQGILLGLGGE